MFKKTEEAAANLAGAVVDDATAALVVAKAAVVPAVAGLFGTLAGYANKLKEGIEDGSLFKPASVEPTADPLPTPEQNAAIATLRKVGQSDEAIAEALNVSVLTVKMATPVEA